MEGLILLLAAFIAVAYAFADTLYRQDVPLVAKLAITNLDAAFVLVLEGELWRAYLHDDYLIMKVMVVNCQRRPHVRLHAITRKRNT